MHEWGHVIPANTPDGRKWTARSIGSRWSRGGGWGRGENRTLQTVLMDGPERKRQWEGWEKGGGGVKNFHSRRP